MKTLILVLLVNVVGFCQTAKVVALSSQDIRQVSAAKSALDKAQADWNAVRLELEHRYVSDSQEVTGYLTAVGGSTSQFLVASGSLTWSASGVSDKEEDACRRVIQEKFWTDDIERCRKLLDLRSKSKAEQEAEALKEKERLSKAPKTTVYSLKSGWDYGFEFSEDLHYLVPRPPPAITTSYGQWPNVTLTR